MKFFGLAFISLFLFVSCYKEYITVPAYQNNVFVFELPDATVDSILLSREIKIYIDSLHAMTYGNVSFEVDRLNTRGASALNFQRKSFAVNLTNAMPFAQQDEDAQTKAFEKFKLIAMVFDYTYIENRLSHIMLNKLNLWPLYSFYTELMLNDLHQGLYLFIEDPDEFLFENKGANVVIRRDYKGNISELMVSGLGKYSENAYRESFKSIYNTLTLYKGEQLYQKLSEQMNIDNYMRKMAFDMLVENGDNTDEIFFYGIETKNGVYFDILPWDYDDIFAGKPHEVGRSWAIGNIFGERIYTSHDEVLNELQGRLIFTIEDDIEYAIAFDDYMYARYLENLKWVLNVFDTKTIEASFAQVYAELAPFYNKPIISEQSVYDVDATNKELFESNYTEKLNFLKERRQWINQQIE